MAMMLVSGINNIKHNKSHVNVLKSFNKQGGGAHPLNPNNNAAAVQVRVNCLCVFDADSVSHPATSRAAASSCDGERGTSCVLL
jgi:hypothetical protein